MNLKTGLWILVFCILWIVGLIVVAYIEKHPTKQKTSTELEWDRLEAEDNEKTSNIVTIEQLGPVQKGYTFYEVFNHNHRYLLIVSPNNSITMTECK